MDAKPTRRKSWPDEKLISRALSVKTDRAYWDTVYELRSRASEKLYERCMELIGSALQKERKLGVDVVGQWYRINKRKKYGRDFPHSKEILQLLLGMLAVEKATDMIISILYGVGYHNDHIKPKNIDAIIPFVTFKDKNVRFAAMSALSGIHTMKAVRGLITLSKDRNSHIRDWATFTIGTQSDLDNDEIRSALYARCTDKHHDTRMEAIYGLAKRKDDGVKKYLEKDLDEWTVYVLVSIQALNAKEYLPRLEVMLEETEHDPDTYQYWLGHLKDCIATLRGDLQTT